MPKQLEMLDAPAEDATSLPPAEDETSSEDALDVTEPGHEEEEAAPVATTPVAVKPVVEALPGLRPWADICAGVVLGGAIGDAMGHPTEFIGSVSSIRAK